MTTTPPADRAEVTTRFPLHLLIVFRAAHPSCRDIYDVRERATGIIAQAGGRGAGVVAISRLNRLLAPEAQHQYVLSAQAFHDLLDGPERLTEMRFVAAVEERFPVDISLLGTDPDALNAELTRRWSRWAAHCRATRGAVAEMQQLVTEMQQRKPLM